MIFIQVNVLFIFVEFESDRVSPCVSAKNGRIGAHGLKCKICVISQLIFEIYDKNYFRKKCKSLRHFWNFRDSTWRVCMSWSFDLQESKGVLLSQTFDKLYLSTIGEISDFYLRNFSAKPFSLFTFGVQKVKAIDLCNAKIETIKILKFWWPVFVKTFAEY